MQNAGGSSSSGAGGGRGGTRDMLDLIFTYVNRTLFLFKLFYFFFFAAFGSIYPLITVYFKQVGMNATQAGLLVGLRPFVEFFSAPLWSALADRWKRGKTILLGALFCWIVFTLSISFVSPKAEGCFAWANTSKMSHRVLPPFQPVPDNLLDWEAHKTYSVAVGISPIPLANRNVVNKDDYADQNMVIPRHATVVYNQDRINQVFIVLLVLILIGEFFSAPAISIADSAVLNYLGEDQANYGRQRIFGSIGWALAMFIIGISLDQSTSFPNHPCGMPGRREKNYVIAFAMFTVLMSFALLTATQFVFQYDGTEENLYFNAMKDKVSQKLFGKKAANQRLDNNDADWDGQQGAQGRQMTDDDIIESQLKIKLERRQPDAVSDTLDPYADFTADHFHFTEWLTALRLFNTLHLAAFLFVSLFMGMGVGIVFTFLFWHLQDLDGTPTLFGIASVINHVSEILAYFLSNKFIESVGHVNALYLGLLGNGVRFLFVSLLNDPWWVLPFEFIQGLTHATVWAACISYITQSIPRDNRASCQGLLQGIHHCLGKGLGTILGGVLTSSYGSRVMFRTYSILSFVVLVAFLALHYFMEERKDAMATELPKDDPDYNAGRPPGASSASQGGAPVGGIVSKPSNDPRDFYEESTYLSPHGIPFAPSNRDLIKTRPQTSPGNY